MSHVTSTLDINDSLLASLLSDENFVPARPASIEETGLGEEFVEQAICKYLAVFGTNKGRSVADHLCLPFNVIEPLLGTLRTNQLVVHAGSAPFNDYYYSLTAQGRSRAMSFLEACGYVGPAPVPLSDYVISVEAQSITAESPGPEKLAEAVRGISVDPNLFESLGPAINSGAGMFLYGAPGNGKSTLAKRITLCFGQEIWIPHALYEDGQIIKFYDSAYHKPVINDERGITKCGDHDRRWLKISRPTVVVGGELTMDNLELRHDPRSNINEAPLQMKSNCGCLLIDDFGRQRIEPGATAQPLDRAAGNAARLPHAAHGQEAAGAVRPTGDLLHEPGAARPGRRGLPAADPLQDRDRRPERGGVPRVVPASTPGRSAASIAAR